MPSEFVMFDNVLLLLAEAGGYFSIMASLLYFRDRLGLGVFVCALGVMHFLETYLAAVFYVRLPFGTVSPGSVVFFSGKLVLILLLYLKEDAAAVRQPIYGLLIGNFLIIGLAMILKLHVTVTSAGERPADMKFLDEMGILMVWGTLLLYIDSLGIILLYERFGSAGVHSRTLRILLAGACMLTFDQAGFFAALRWLYGVGPGIFWGGLAAKLLAAVFYSGLTHLYFMIDSTHRRKQVADIFNDLTFRERYESLLASSGRDSLTGVLNRARFDRDMPRLLANIGRNGTRACIAIADIDFFKRINDRFGHLTGDDVLKAFANGMRVRLGEDAYFYRYGGEEFVMICLGHERSTACQLLDDIRNRMTAELRTPVGEPVTFCVGVAEYGADGVDLSTLMNVADMRLYAAKQAGRNRVY